MQSNFDFIIRLGINLLSVFILIRLIFFRFYKKNDQFLTFFVFNIVIFMITFLLNKVEMTMGAAFGLFAVFSMLRFRTENIQTKDMTYLFLVIAIGLISAISKGVWYELLLLNIFILLVTVLLESSILIKKTEYIVVHYDSLSLLLPEKRDELFKDIAEKSGILGNRIEIIEVDFLKDCATIHVFFNPS